jgi:hypothetical protein
MGWCGFISRSDPRDQEYPVKNWNVRVIEEDDIMFDLVIPTRQPYHVPVIFGQIRTEFGFSENIYNMDEYNGSTRDSTDPCDIDKDFFDCCSACLSSKFNLDLGIQDLSNDRLVETLRILEEYKPFHAVLHYMNFSGTIEEFLFIGNEEVETLVRFVQDENVYGGNLQTIFSRTMEHGRTDQAIRRNALADLSISATDTGTVSSQDIVLYSPDVDFRSLGIDNWAYESDPTTYIPGSNNNLLEVMPPASGVAGDYVVSGEIQKNVIRIDQGSPDTVSEPLNAAAFTYRLSNLIYTNPTNSIYIDNINTFTDSTVDFAELGVKTTWDVENDPDYTGGAWKIVISLPASHAGTYTIENILSDGSLVLEGSFPFAVTGIGYDLKDDSDVTIESSNLGDLEIEDRARVVITDLTVDDIRLLLKTGDYILFGGTQYEIIGFVEGAKRQVYIKDYTGAGAAGAIKVYRRLVDGATGYVDYRGLQLTTTTDYESTLGIINGASAPGYPWPDGGFLAQGSGTEDDHYKESFLILIGTDYFVFKDIDGTTIELDGPRETWPTTGIAGTAFTIYRAVKEPFSVPEQIEPPGPGHDFSWYDRRGKVIITQDIETGVPMTMRALALNPSSQDQVLETVNQNEEVSFSIEYLEE